MEKLEADGAYFDVARTLGCGQIFRYEPYEKGFLVHSADKTCYAFNEGTRASVVCEDGDGPYFYRYFDLERNYGAYVSAAEKSGAEVLAAAARAGKGIRILNQNAEETVFSFIVSQNNMIPRIKKILGRLSDDLGGTHAFCGREYRSFPTAEALASADVGYFSAAGLGYRDEYVALAARALRDGALSAERLAALSTAELKKELCSLRGVGPKVADCIALFGFHRFDVFPADTWIVRLYREDFGGREKDAKKIAAYFTERFGVCSGIFQQYLFDYKRGGEKV